MMLNKLNKAEKEEIVFNGFLLRRAIDEIARLTSTNNESVLTSLFPFVEADVATLTEADIDAIIASLDAVRASIEEEMPDNVYLVTET